MEEYKRAFNIIWADLDPNSHMRHTAYNNYAAQVRVNIFSDLGAPVHKMVTMGIGPILFREETKFLKEVLMNETITVDCCIAAMRSNGTKFRFIHNIFKESGEKSAIVVAEGSWLDLNLRKITAPPEEIIHMMHDMPKTEDFEWIPDKQG
ncbi:MAG: acyl-CoA thioesterase [Bacteroidota bacterium]